MLCGGIKEVYGESRMPILYLMGLSSLVQQRKYTHMTMKITHLGLSQPGKK